MKIFLLTLFTLLLSTTIFCEATVVRSWKDQLSNEICYEYTADSINDLVKIVKKYSGGLANITEKEGAPYEYIIMEDPINIYTLETEEKGSIYYLRRLEKANIKR